MPKEVTIARINEALLYAESATTREGWNAALRDIRALMLEIPLAREIGDVVLPTFGGYRLSQAIGPSGVLRVTLAVLQEASEPFNPKDTPHA